MFMNEMSHGNDAGQRPLGCGHTAGAEEPIQTCLVKIGSVTRASRAREILLDNGIRTGIRRMSMNPEGCAHGITLSPADLKAALDILCSAGIKAGNVYETNENQRGYGNDLS